MRDKYRKGNFSSISSKFAMSLAITVLITGFPAFSQEVTPNNNTINNPITVSEQQTETSNVLTAEALKPITLKEENDTTQKSDGFLRSWVREDYATGNWNQFRSQLEEHGIKIESTYYAEPFMKLHGGLDHKVPVKYLGVTDTALTIDTEKLTNFWKGGTVLARLQNKHGHSLSGNNVGDYQMYSNLDAPEFTDLAEYWVEQKLLPRDLLKVKVGKQDANYDFSSLESSFNFLNSSLSLIPTVPMPTYGIESLGVLTTIQPTDWASLKVGVYDGESGGVMGFKTAFNGDVGAVTLIEGGVTPNIKNHQGNYIVGYWIHSGDGEKIGSANTFSSNHGVYTAFEQKIFNESKDSEDDQGLTIQGQFGWAPDDRSELSRYYGAGVQYKGLIPKRDEDIIGLGSAVADFSSRCKAVDGKTVETALELFYKVQLTPWFSLQPDLQYIVNPNGNHKDALLTGIRTTISF